MEKKNCRFCMQPLLGRLDKKFCDDQCRSAFNNRIYSENNQQMRKVNSVLKRNRKILEALFEGKNTEELSVQERKIQELGFVFNFHTHTRKVEGGKTCVCCYDYGYIPLQKGELAVIKIN